MTRAAMDLEQAKLDPASVFHAPKDVLGAPGLSPEDKKSILVRWEADVEACCGRPRKACRRPTIAVRLSCCARCMPPYSRSSDAPRNPEPRRGGCLSRARFRFPDPP